MRQFTIFLENRVGRLRGLLQCVEESAGKICAMSIEESADCALIRIICSEPDQGREALKNGGNSPSANPELLAVELPKPATRQPADCAICTALIAAEINIHSAYHPAAAAAWLPAIAALRVEDPILSPHACSFARDSR